MQSGEKRWPISLPLNAEERGWLDALRGSIPRTVYIRQLLHGAAGFLPERMNQLGEALQGAQAAEVGSIAVPAPPSPPEKESLVLPELGKPDAHGWHYRYMPRFEGSPVGTLAFAQPGEDWQEMDLIGVELERLEDGSTLVRFSDRSLVRLSAQED